MVQKYSDSIKSISAAESDSSLYNIGSISFNNIKDPEGIELSQQFAFLVRLEERGLLLTDEIGRLGIGGLSLSRRAFPTHSAFLFRLSFEGKRGYIELDSEEAANFRETLSEVQLDILEGYVKELVLLNANLKVSWTYILQTIEARNAYGVTSTLDGITPKDVNQEFIEQRAA